LVDLIKVVLVLESGGLGPWSSNLRSKDQEIHMTRAEETLHGGGNPAREKSVVEHRSSDFGMLGSVDLGQRITRSMRPQ
jgi:hypothetical protein